MKRSVNGKHFGWSYRNILWDIYKEHNFSDGQLGQLQKKRTLTSQRNASSELEMTLLCCFFSFLLNVMEADNSW